MTLPTITVRNVSPKVVRLAAEAKSALARASTLLSPVHWEAQLTKVLWHGAPLRASASGVPVCETLFFELAVRSDCPL